jgi:hypothetical protein
MSVMSAGRIIREFECAGCRRALLRSMFFPRITQRSTGSRIRSRDMQTLRAQADVREAHRRHAESSAPPKERSARRSSNKTAAQVGLILGGQGARPLRRAH